MNKLSDTVDILRELYSKPFKGTYNFPSNKLIWVVLEHHKPRQDAILHGVYHRKDWAENKKKQIEKKYNKTKKKPGYICILKKRLI